MTDTPATVRHASAEKARAVSPALEMHMQARVVGELWDRPDLGARDRSPPLIAGGQVGPLGTYADKALRSGVTSAQVSEAGLLHLAYPLTLDKYLDRLPGA